MILKERMNKSLDFKFGCGFMTLYLVWFFAWVLLKYFILGTIDLPYFPTINLEAELFSPLEQNYLLGTDLYGRSIIEVLSSGLSYSLTLGLFVTLLASFIGVLFGYLSVISNDFVNSLLDMMTNLIFVFPSILIAIVFMSIVGTSLVGLITVLVFTGWPSYARIARGEIKRVLGLSYIESARAIGVSELRLFFRVIIPSILPQMIIHMVLGISGVIISESVLGFLGLGASEYSWGTLLSMGKNVLLEAPHVTIILSLTMAGLIIGLNLLGDGLRDILDPRG